MGRRGSNLASTVGIGSLTSCFLEREMWRFLKLSFVGTLSRGEKATAGAFLRCRKESLHLLKLMIPWSYPRATPWATWTFLFRMQRWSAMLDLFFFIILFVLFSPIALSSRKHSTHLYMYFRHMSFHLIASTAHGALLLCRSYLCPSCSRQLWQNSTALWKSVGVNPCG